MELFRDAISIALVVLLFLIMLFRSTLGTVGVVGAGFVELDRRFAICFLLLIRVTAACRVGMVILFGVCVL